MKRTSKINSILIVFVLASALTCLIKAQSPQENMTTFFDSDVPGMRIQVNATTETQPSENVSATLSLEIQTDVNEVQIEYLNFSIFGFINGTYRVLMTNITDNSISLNAASKEYNSNCTFLVPERVWDATYGEITLTYNATESTESGTLVIMATKLYDKLKFGFPMTHVENTYLKQVEQDRQTLNSTLAELKQVFSQLSNEDLTPDSLNKTISNLQGSAGELDNTRRAVIALTATTVVFVATTVYMFLRKPSQYL
jgi:hypothetical protein